MFPSLIFGALMTVFSLSSIRARVPIKPIKTPIYFLLEIFSFNKMTEIRKINIGVAVTIIELLIGVE